MVFDRSLLGFLWEIVSRFLCVSMIWNPCRPSVGQGQWHGMGPQLNSGAQVSLAYWTHSWWQHSQLQIDRCPGGHVRDPTIRVVSDKVVTAPRSHSLSSQLSDLLFFFELENLHAMYRTNRNSKIWLLPSDPKIVVDYCRCSVFMNSRFLHIRYKKNNAVLEFPKIII